jgi:hypothetical protein
MAWSAAAGAINTGLCTLGTGLLIGSTLLQITVSQNRRMKGDKSGTHQRIGEWGHRLGRNLLFEINADRTTKTYSLLSVYLLLG